MITLDDDAWAILNKLPTEECLSDNKFGSYVHDCNFATLVFNRKRGILEIWTMKGWMGVKVENIIGCQAPEVETKHGR